MSEPQHPPISIDPAFMQRVAEVHNRAAEAHEAHEAQLRQQFATLAADQPQQQHMQGTLPAPPGFVGALAQFIYQQAPRPVPEVAIVAALGAIAGIAGRGWSISGTGLNLYVILVARSAIGKEAMHSGISMLVRAAIVDYPQVGDSFDFSDYASGQALIKACAQNPCFVNVSSEIGHKFMAMAKDREPAMRTYRKTLTDLYSKSGPNGIAGGIAYSNQEGNTASTHGVAFSLIGETTPTNFFESITPAMMGDGFMSRFCVIEYTEERPDENRARLQSPPPELVSHFNIIARQAMLLESREQFQSVAIAHDAQALLDRFSTECDHAIRAAGDDEGRRQLWNRAHLKVLRVAGLLAVGDNPFAPTVTLAQAEWAVMLIRHGITAFLRRLDTGEVGEGTDGGREQKVLDLCREFLTLPAGSKKLADYKRGADMQQAGIVPRRFLQHRTQRMSAFENHKLGHTAALNMAIKTAITNGNLMAVKKDTLVEQFGFHGEAYRVLSLS